MKRSTLAAQYIGGLTHAHTVLSNHTGHRESNLTIDRIVTALTAGRLVGEEEAPLGYVLLNEHPSDPANPRPLGRLSPRGRRLLRQRRRPVVGRVPVLYGLEASLLPNGRTDLTPRLTNPRPLVIASRHALPESIEREAESIHELFMTACDHPLVDVLGHPPRYIEDLTDVNWPEIFMRARATGTAIEVNMNTFPDATAHRLQKAFWPVWLKELAVSDADVFIGTDIHSQLQLDAFVSQWHELDEDASYQENHLARFIDALHRAKIRPERVITSSLETIRNWTAMDKSERARLH